MDTTILINALRWAYETLHKFHSMLSGVLEIDSSLPEVLVVTHKPRAKEVVNKSVEIF